MNLDDFFETQEERDSFFIKIIEQLDGTDFSKKIKEYIDETSAFVESYYPNRIVPEEPIYYEKGRASRTFEFELSRLWRRAITTYIEHRVGISLPYIQEELGDKTAHERISKYNEACLVLIETRVIPLLNEHENVGDDALLFVKEMMGGDDDYVRNGFLATDLAPSQSEYAFLGMIGLLLRAKHASTNSDLSQAYAYLIDAAELIGMHDGSAFITKRLDKIVKSRRAQESAYAKQESYKKAAARVEELFHSLKPKDKKKWKSASGARNAIMRILDKEALDAGLEKPAIAVSSVYTICKELYATDVRATQQTRPKLQAVIRLEMPNGDIVDAPIGMTSDKTR
ncbi:hypothetical protein V2K65_26110 [Pseudomonas alliivorans]|nr:hypothetical protein [Pseudomonas alliivorans]